MLQSNKVGKRREDLKGKGESKENRVKRGWKEKREAIIGEDVGR